MNSRDCFTITNGKPTYWSSDQNEIPDVIDFYIAKRIFSNYLEVSNIDDLSSDHSLVGLAISATVLIRTIPTNWELFLEKLSNLINLNIKLKAPDDLDSAVTGLTNLIIESAVAATPN